ncbi:MAG: valine--tRNA ligase [Bdellovibrionales bacterium]|nr:valine--tRNA ligase [Bdellovibrionales bacterium]
MKKREIPEKYEATSIEAHWRQQWDESGIYGWDSERPRSETFVVDTPPPTVSGSLHVGHVFSYTQTDTIVRYQRMLGKNIFYPIGWDDNGLPTERRVQNYFGIKCEPHLPYDPDWKPNHEAAQKSKEIAQVSRRNFTEACALLTQQDEAAFERLWRTVGLSVDWSLQYATIDEHCRRTSQISFLDLVQKDQVYNSYAPTMWDVDFRSAISQAEIEDREIAGAFHDIHFGTEDGESFIISTTRPELLAACVAVVAHPDDPRYQSLFGKTALTPLFKAPVPIQAAEHADPEKGSGILMVCTFGDLMDVEWWRRAKLPLKQIIGLDGRIMECRHGEGAFSSQAPDVANRYFAEIKGLTVKQAQKKIVELLGQDGTHPQGSGAALAGQPKPITHPVKFYEKGDRPLELIPTRQWFQKTIQHKQALLEQGRKVSWHPAHMLTRYEHWVQGLNQDWCLSRQRYFGVPFPVWYKIDAAGQVDYGAPIFADRSLLPVDPLSDTPPGFNPEDRDQPGGFCGDPDVMDTWATSCLTPQIASHWQVNPERHAKLFPMDLRPQAHDIIRTWAFVTIVRAWNHEQQIPWKHAVISGFVTDPDRKKMSKSKGNVVTPEGLLQEHSADAVRYWAARARLGVDTAFDQKLFGIGRKLSTKIFNAAKFVMLQLERVGYDPHQIAVSEISSPLDCAMAMQLKGVIETATRHFEAFEYAIALQVSEDAFWQFCDHYLELVKSRSYSEEDSAERRSALTTLAWSLKTFLRLLAPFLPFVTEEVWSWSFSEPENQDSVHKASWPRIEEISGVSERYGADTLEAAIDLIAKIRGFKTANQKSLKWEVSKLTITCNAVHKERIAPVLADVLRAGNVVKESATFIEAPEEAETTLEIELNPNWQANSGNRA